MHDSKSNTDSARPKQRRAPRACDECRKRKVRCDSASMPNGICSGCSTVGIECIHSTSKRKRGPRIGSSRKAPSEMQMMITSILASPQSFAIPDDPEAVNALLVDLATYARALERDLELARRAHPSGNGVALFNENSQYSQSADSPQEDSEDDLPVRVDGITLDHVQGRHIGESSHLMLLRTALDIRDELNGDNHSLPDSKKRPEFWSIAPWHHMREPEELPYVFPEADLMRELIDHYFIHIHPFLPLFHRPTLEKGISEKLYLTDRGFGGIILAICAHGCRHTQDPRALFEGSTSEHSLGWKYFTQIPLMRASSVYPPTLYDIQLCALATSFLYTTPIADSAWAVGGLGIRCAQEVGAHRKKMTRQRDRKEAELWKLAFWQLVMMDLFMSTALGRPRATTEDDFDIDYPIECDAEYWDHPDPNLAFVQPEGKPSYMTFWVKFIKLLHVVAFAKRTVYAIRKTEIGNVGGDSMKSYNVDIKACEKVVTELDSTMKDWLDTMPDHLKWDLNREDDVFHHQSLVLYSAYNWVKIQIHKPFIRPGPTSSLNFTSLAVCANAARTYVHMVDVDRRSTLVMSPHIMAPVFSCAVILLINIWKGIRVKSIQDPYKEMADVYRCLKIMSLYETRYETAGRLRDVLEAVMAASCLPPYARRPSLKRSRESSHGAYMQDATLDEEKSEGGSSADPRRFSSSSRLPLAVTASSPYQSSFSIEPLYRPNPAFRPWVMPSNSESTSIASSTSASPIITYNLEENILGDTPQHMEYRATQNLDGTHGHQYMYPSQPGMLNLSADPVDSPPQWSDTSGSGNAGGHGDWDVFMSRVDELLQFVNPQGFS